MTAAAFGPITLLQPGTISFGAGTAAGCVPALLHRNCRHIAVVTSPSVKARAAQLFAELPAGMHVTRLDDVPAEPDVGVFNRLHQQLRGQPLDAVVGIGGGSVLDVAKLLAGLHGEQRPVGAFFGSGLAPQRRVALLCLPTTAGTGSEVSPNAILYDPAERIKKAVISPHLVPDVAIVDPELTVSAPPALTAATGVDALVHCLEAYANRNAHPIVDVYALNGIRLIARHLPRAVANGQDRDARSAVALGSLYGGLCLGPVNTAAVHALAYPLGSEFRLAHGLSNALLLPHVVRFNLPAAPDRYAAIAESLGVGPGGSPEERAHAGVTRLEELAAACGLPRGLAAVGVSREAIPGLAAAAMKVTRLLKNNPRAVSVHDAIAIYEQAL